MKKLLAFLLCLFAGISVQAGRVSEQEALLKARQFMQDRQFKHSDLRRAPSKDVASTAYYVFNAADDGGFVIVAGDDQMRDILGYAEEGSFDLDSIPDNVRWLFDYYTLVAQSLSVEDAAGAPASHASRPELQPLVTTTWDQWAPYNAHCPVIDGQPTPTGCVATAMAQVVNYYQWPISEVRSVSEYYTTDAQVYMPSLPARRFSWYGMSDDEIAWLMRYCGQAVQMNYMPVESGAYGDQIANALVATFNYSKTAKLVERSSYSDDEWEELMYGELSVGRPVIYSGMDGQSGHSFILHGYRDGLFCVNWGWSGNCDGYFALTNLSPNDSRHYNEYQTAVVAIQPSSMNDDTIGEVERERTIHLDKAGTLANFISAEDKYAVTKLTLSGEINGDDIILIRDMAGYNGSPTDGQLITLDLSDARIVSGGNAYFYDYKTKDNVFGYNLLCRCDKLQELVLPTSITTISGASFCSRLKALVIPKGVTLIEGGAFEGCDGLTSLVVEEGNPIYYSPENSNAVIERSSGNLIGGCPLTTIPEGVTTIGMRAFYGLQSLTSIKLPESLTDIETRGFDGCALVTLHIPRNVKYIGPYTFAARALKSITVDSGNSVYDSRNNCNCLIETASNTLILGCQASQIPEGVVAIGEEAFELCRELTSIVLPQSLERIDMMAFQRCGLRVLEIPAGVTTIGDYAFAYNNRLRTVKVKSQTPPNIANWTFNQISDNAKLIVPAGTKEQYMSANVWKQFPVVLEDTEYQSKRTLTVMPAGSLSTLLTADEAIDIEELTLKGELNNDDFMFIRESMGEGALRIIDMTDARVIDGTTYDVLCEGAFVLMGSLEEVRLPRTLKSISRSIFTSSGLKSIVIPKSVTSIGTDVFYQCGSLSSISVEPGNPFFDSRGDCNAIIETETNVLLMGCRSTVIPESVVEIGVGAFSGVPGLTSVELPDGVRKIGAYAFWADKGLSKVRLAKTVVEIDHGPFVGCTNIRSFVIDPENPVYDSRDNCNAIIETASNTLIQGFTSSVIPETVVKIAPEAFWYQQMSYIEIPASVTEIGSRAFLYCDRLTSVVTRIRKPYPIKMDVFEGENMRNAVLYVPFGTKNAYSITTGWASFPNIVEMEPTGDEYDRHVASVVEPDFGRQYVGLNSQTEVPVYLLGENIEPITNIDYTITTGSNVFEGHLEVSPITYMMTAEVLIPFSADATIGEKAKTLTITKVNGQDNEATEKSVTGTLVTVKRKPRFVPLVEEATGAWCGMCPRGAVGMKLLNKTFRDDVVTVAVHYNDPMELPDYSLHAYSYPSCMINRGAFIDPYYGSSDMPFGIRKDVEAAQRQYTIGEIAVDADWANASQTAISVTTTTTFVEDVASSPYQIGYMLLEDGQTGTTSDWAQSNYYSGTSINDDNLKRMVDSPAKIQDMKYDDVPVAVWQPLTGVAGTLPASITSEVPMSYTYTLDISGITRIQHKEKLSVVALLLNKDTHEVLNVARFRFAPLTEPSVVTVTSCSRIYGDANPEFEYTVTGGELEGVPEIVCEAVATSPVGEYPIVIRQGTVTNDDVTFVNGTLTVKKAQLTVNAGNYTKKQGEAMPTFKATYTGFKNHETEDVLTQKPFFACDATADSAPGEYIVSVSGAKSLNYSFKYVSGKLTVLEADPLTITANSYTREYGEPNPVFGFTSVGADLQGRPELVCDANEKSPVGTYDIVVRQGSVSNYNVTYVNGKLTIVQAPLKAIAGNYEREEGEENPEFIITYEGWKNGEDEHVLLTKPVATTEATKDSPAGTYPIVVSGGKAQNYAIEHVNGVLTITVPSALVEISTDHPADIYDMRGCLVRRDAVTLRGLDAGVYIIRMPGRADRKIVVGKP